MITDNGLLQTILCILAYKDNTSICVLLLIILIAGTLIEGGLLIIGETEDS